MAEVLELENRGVVRISGPDSKSLLQGLITSDIEDLSENNALYAALLTPQGKFLFDMLIVQDGDDLLLDTEAERKPDLLRRLMMYKLRADAEITDDARSVWALFDGEAQSGIAYLDPRHKAMHQRVISADCPAPDAAPLPIKKYEERRIRHGVPDSSRDMKVEKDFWLETDAERLNGVSFTKGCFVGQELTARMKHRMTLKKKLVTLKSDEADIPLDAEIKTEAGKSAGEVRTGQGPYAIAYFRLEYSDQPLFADGVPVSVDDHKLS